MRKYQKALILQEKGFKEKGGKMSKNFLKFLLILFLALGLSSISLAQARQTGSIHGTVVDEEGNVLPGATVTLSGPRVMGTKTYITSETGKFRFPALLPGKGYEIKVEMPGFKTTIRKGLIVSVGKTTEITITLEVATIEEEVTVTAESPVVDVETSKVSVHYDTDFLVSIPYSRDLYGIQNSIPGAISEGVDYRRTSSILGGTVRSALYQLDGVPMNDPTTWYSMANINVDVYEEIEFGIGSLPAEIGQTDSVVINIVTKSGGNKFTGNATAYYTGDSLAQDLWTDEQISALEVVPPEKHSDYKDGSLSFGGPLLRDRFWFFLNGRRIVWGKANPEIHDVRMAKIAAAAPPGTFTAAELQHYDIDHEEWMGFAKMTFQLAKNIRYMAMYHYNHLYEPVYSNRTGDSRSWAVTAIWDHENTHTTTHQFNWVLDQNTFLDLRGTYLHRHFPIMMRPEYANNYTTYDRTQEIYWGNTWYTDDYIRKKLLVSTSITRFQDEFLGASHEFKAGAEFEDSVYFRDRCRGYEKGDNPYYTYWRDYVKYMQTGNNKYKYYYSTSRKEGRLRIRPYPEHGVWKAYDNARRYSAFAQDSIITGRLAINLGLRFDYAYAYEPEQERPAMYDRYKVGPEWLNPALAAMDPNILLKALNDQYHNDPSIEFNQTSALDPITTPYKEVVKFVTLSPRIGFVYDLFGDGKTAIKLSFARYYEPVWTGKYNAGQLFGGSMNWSWYDRNGNGYMDLPVPAEQSKYGKAPANPAYTDPNGDEYRLRSYDVQDPNFNYYIDDLKAPYMNEFLAGIEHELVKDFKLGLQFVYKVNKNIVEDVDKNNGYDPDAVDDQGRPIWIPYTATDPGWDAEFGTDDDQQITVYGLAEYAPTRAYHGVNPAEAKREYIAGILTFDKRMSNKWQLKGSILYSAFKGNHDPGYSATEGESGMFDNPNTMINSYGRVAFDRPLQIKIMGTYILPYDFILTAYIQHRSGRPWARSIDRVYFPSGFESQDSYASGILAETIGSRRNAPYTNLDLRLEKSFTLGEYGKLSLYLDVFNVGGRSGIQVNRNPYARLKDWKEEYKLSSTYGQITGVYGVRSVRFGMRYTF